MLFPVIVATLGLLHFARLIRSAVADPMVRGLVIALVIVLAVGTISYRVIEGWSTLDSLYFSVVTLLTIGYGDFAPETTFGKIFTIAYCFTGVGLFAAGATTIVQRSELWARIQALGLEDGSEEAVAEEESRE